MQSKEDDDMTSPLSPGVKFLINLVMRIEENLKKTSGNFEFDKFPCQHCNLVYFRSGLHVGIIPHQQISRDLHQKLSELFLLEHAAHSEHPFWKSSFALQTSTSQRMPDRWHMEEPSIVRGALGERAQSKRCMSSQTQSSAQAQVR